MICFKNWIFPAELILQLLLTLSRSSHRRRSVKKGDLKSFASFTGKYLWWSVVANIQACNFVTKRLQKRCFPVKFTKFLKTPISKNICKRLLLSFSLPTILLCNNFIVSIVLTRFNSWLFSFFHYTISVNKLIFFKDNKIHSCDVITELGKTKLIFWSMGKTAKKSRVGRSAK